jgi:hypothetical protein
MGFKELVMAMIAVLFHHRSLWQSLKVEGKVAEDVVLKEYAIPVIALVQFVKFFLAGNPRHAMVFVIMNFLVDISALYLLMRGAAYLFEYKRSEAVTLLCYAMTPVWLFELFFFSGSWSIYFALFALLYTLVISRNGLIFWLDLDFAASAPAVKMAAFFLVIVNSAAFFFEQGRDAVV